MADWAALKRKYELLRQLREAVAPKAGGSKHPKPPSKHKPAPPPRVQKAAPVRAQAAPTKGLNKALAAAGIGEMADEVRQAKKAQAPPAKEVKRPGVSRKRQPEPAEPSLRDIITGATPIDAPVSTAQQSGPKSSTLFINQLPRFCGQYEISNSFGRFGDIEALYLVPNRGCGYIKYGDTLAVDKAIQEMNNVLFGGSKILTEGFIGDIPDDAQRVWVKEDLDYKPAAAKPKPNKDSINPQPPKPPPPPRKKQRMMAYEFD